ncbi:hypothetical protein GCM10009821_07740 [Aeromicrobium halocynthiae]|uniref:Uncharacterized protein n=1 Tax=Aeromicrobium halocynthiae TaxID=560557 RepID=A0ABN2VTH7_9ACTN
MRQEPFALGHGAQVLTDVGRLHDVLERRARGVDGIGENGVTGHAPILAHVVTGRRAGGGAG